MEARVNAVCRRGMMFSGGKKIAGSGSPKTQRAGVIPHGSLRWLLPSIWKFRTERHRWRDAQTLRRMPGFIWDMSHNG